MLYKVHTNFYNLELKKKPYRRNNMYNYMLRYNGHFKGIFFSA